MRRKKRLLNKMILPIPDFNITEDVYIDEMLILRKSEIIYTVKAKLNFIQYVDLYENRIKMNGNGLQTK